jgi:hypothetical protein
VLASSFQRTFVRNPRISGGENGCKGTTFFLSRKLFFTFFSKNFLLLDYQINRKTKNDKKTHKNT